MRILLSAANFCSDPYPVYPLGMSVIAGALAAAWAICTAILLSGRYAGKFLGAKALSALESLMGLLLTTMAVEMIIAGIKYAFLSK